MSTVPEHDPVLLLWQRLCTACVDASASGLGPRELQTSLHEGRRVLRDLDKHYCKTLENGERLDPLLRGNDVTLSHAGRGAVASGHMFVWAVGSQRWGRRQLGGSGKVSWTFLVEEPNPASLLVGIVDAHRLETDPAVSAGMASELYQQEGSYAFASWNRDVFVNGQHSPGYGGYPNGRVFASQSAKATLTLDAKSDSLALTVSGRREAWRVEGLGLGAGREYRVLLDLYCRGTRARMTKCVVTM